MHKQTTIRPAIEIDDHTCRMLNEHSVAQAVTACRHQLPGAVRQVWRQHYWQVVEQAYDLPELYVSYIEVQVRAPDTVIPIRCPKHDLYWLYLLRGRLDIHPPGDRKGKINTTERHYRLSYLPAARYQCRFNVGTHGIFYVVHKPTSLFREDSEELPVTLDPINFARHKLTDCVTSESLSTKDGSAAAISAFLLAPGKTYLKRVQAIKHLAYKLIFIAHESLRGRAPAQAVAADWAGQMKAYIDDGIERGEHIDVHTVAQQFRVSAGYVRYIFTSHLNRPIGRYITDSKLDYAKLLLLQGQTTMQVSNYLGWGRSHFSITFKARFGISPGRYRKDTVR